MDICTEYVNLQRDTLNKVDHLRARILIVVDLEVNVTQKSQGKVTFKEVRHKVVNRQHSAEGEEEDVGSNDEE